MAATVIAIPTFRRPDRLRDLIAAIAALDGLEDAMLLVADNDAGGEGAAVAAAMAPGLPIPVEIIRVPEAGLCHVRNAIVGHALAIPAMRRLAMIDDDEWPQPQWLTALVDVQKRTGAAVVGGPVDPVFAQGAPSWADQTLVFRSEHRLEGPTDMLHAANNLLVTRAALQALGAPWFDPAFNRSGGEDLDFLTRLKAIGFDFAWAPRARVAEWVGADRARKAWVLRRMWRIGVTDTMVACKSRSWPVLILRALALLGLRTAALPGLAWRRRRLDVAGQWVKAVARLYALAGGGDALYAAPPPLSSPTRGSS